MRTRILLIMFTFVCIGQLSYAQVCIGLFGSPNKITVGQSLSRATATSYFGTPVSYDSFYEDENIEARIEPYTYDKFWFMLADSRVYEFSTTSPAYVVTINNKLNIRVGDNYNQFITQIRSSGTKFDVSSTLTTVWFNVPGLTGSYRFGELHITKDSKGLIDGITWYVNN